MREIEQLEQAIKELRNTTTIKTSPLVYCSGGTGLPDEACIEYFKDTSVIVIIRNGDKYQYGKLIEAKEAPNHE